MQAPALTENVRLPRPIVARIIRDTVNRAKDDIKAGKSLTIERLQSVIRREIDDAQRSMITRVINATGIVVHTNLGRSPLTTSLFDSIRDAVSGYCNIEFNLASGQRGSRGEACEEFLAKLADAEAGTVVNNCAAALFISLCALAKGKYVIISRGELVQIGGGFRIPDILRASGARLREIGTTNITTLKDYRDAVDDKVALILRVHKSNFVQAGFTEDVSLKVLVALGREHNIPVLNDLGSGVFVSTQPLLGYNEPTVEQSVRAGADLTCFSGDKLLGGVQGGLIVGRKDLVLRIKKHPLFRTVRVDKIVLAAFERLLASYLDGTHETEVRLWSNLAVPFEELERRATAIVASLGKPDDIAVVPLSGYVGGGALPEIPVPSCGLRLTSRIKAETALRLLREGSVPIIARIEDDALILDLRTVDPADDTGVTQALQQVMRS